MAFTLSSVLSQLGGELLTYGAPATRWVDTVTPLREFVVIGNSQFSTLVTCSAEELLAIETNDPQHKIPLLRQSIVVTDADTPEIRALLQRERVSGIVGIATPSDSTHLAIELIIAQMSAAEDRMVTAGTQVLTQVARRGGAAAVIAELAQRLGGWAVLLNSHGQLLESAGAGRLHLEDAVAVALNQPVRVRHVGLHSHPIGPEGDLTGYLVTATRTSTTTRARDLGSQAAALFDLILRTNDPSKTEHLGRQVMIEMLCSEGDEAVHLLRRWGVHENTLCGFLLSSKTKNIEVESLASHWLDTLGEPHLFASNHNEVQGFIREDLAPNLAELAEQFTTFGTSVVNLGIGRPSPLNSLNTTTQQATQAHEISLRTGQPAVTYDSLSTVRYFFNTLDESYTTTLAQVLDPLREEDGKHGSLTHTLRVFLSEHGAWRASAAQLNIHRQTLMNRITRVEELTGLTFDKPDDRATAWLALRSLEQ